MSELHIIRGGKHNSPKAHSSVVGLQGGDVPQFGPPPSLLVGLITGMLGAAVGVVSLLIFFSLWQPEPYISTQWLIFVVIGAVFGFFLRVERAIIAGLNRQVRDLG
jgi:hypothetical protein